jgi:regulator of protease activity HflC (stomatin/prohibitin superfamily)
MQFSDFPVFAFVLVAIILLFLYKSLFVVQQQTSRVVERFGKYLKIANPGLNFCIPFVDQVCAGISLRIMQLDVQAETKTQDNVFVKVMIAVQYQVVESKVYEAYYKLQNPEQQINSFVFDVVRARVPLMKLDDLFEKKNEIADAVQSELEEIMANMGYEIIKALVTDIDPDAKVKAAMNEINEAQRLRVAASERAEAEKIMKVKNAEGDAQSAALQGKGIADQRREILHGLQESITSFKSEVGGMDSQSVMAVVLATQYMDTLRSIGADGKSNTIMLPHSPGGINSLMDQMREVLISANQITTDTQQT